MWAAGARATEMEGERRVQRNGDFGGEFIARR